VEEGVLEVEVVRRNLRRGKSAFVASSRKGGRGRTVDPFFAAASISSAFHVDMIDPLS
jgi:hypothetical protein